MAERGSKSTGTLAIEQRGPVHLAGKADAYNLCHCGRVAARQVVDPDGSRRAHDGESSTISGKSHRVDIDPLVCDEPEPEAPTAGVVHDQPAGAEIAPKSRPAGSVALIDASAALSGPAFITVIG